LPDVANARAGCGEADVVPSAKVHKYVATDVSSSLEAVPSRVMVSFGWASYGPPARATGLSFVASTMVIDCVSGSESCAPSLTINVMV